MTESDRIYLEQMAAALGRRPHTLRQWIREKAREPGDDGNLPDDLVPHREPGRDGGEGRRKIYWLPDQLDGMREFAAMKASRRGWQGA